jgi:hypothetical protein
MFYENLSPELGIKLVTMPQVNPVLHICTLQQKTVGKTTLGSNHTYRGH